MPLAQLLRGIIFSFSSGWSTWLALRTRMGSSQRCWYACVGPRTQARGTCCARRWRGTGFMQCSGNGMFRWKDVDGVRVFPCDPARFLRIRSPDPKEPDKQRQRNKCDNLPVRLDFHNLVRSSSAGRLFSLSKILSHWHFPPLPPSTSPHSDDGDITLALSRAFPGKRRKREKRWPRS